MLYSQRNQLIETLDDCTLLAIVGPTASGKTELALRVAAAIPAEIICADSRTVYKGLDVGTAKPSAFEQSQVPHHGLDIVTPDQTFSAAEFQRYAQQWIADIRKRDKLPIIVGGTGLYVEALLYDYQFGQPIDQERREVLEGMTLEALHKYCVLNNIELPENYKNRRYVIRAIERAEAAAPQGPTKSQQLPPQSRLIGLNPGSDALRARITARAQAIFNGNVIEEAKRAASQYGWGAPGLSGNIYPIIKQLIRGELTQEQAIEQFITSDWRLAKRQRTWWRRDEHIQWYE